MTDPPALDELLMTYDAACFVPEEDRIEALWGSVPHRVSCLTAMARAPAPIKRGFGLDVSGPAVPRDVARRHLVRAYEESDGALFVAARHASGSPWRSTPARALLECLKDEDDVHNGDYAASQVLYRGDVVSPDTVVEVADRLGWDMPLRRLASIATRMYNCRGVFGSEASGLLRDSQWPFLDVPPAAADAEWICLMPYAHPWVSSEPEFRDAKYRVVRWEHPHEFVEHLLW